MNYIFVDTNIFLHFQDFEEIDWLSESSSESCKLIISPVVIDELDEKKIGTGKIAKRARKILNKFERLSEVDGAKINDSIGFEILLFKPNKGVYENNNLNFDEKDHRLIASIIEFSKEKNIENIILCSDDIGPRLRAKIFKIESFKLSSKYFIPSQLSEEEKRIKELEKENQKLKNSIPKLDVFFIDNSKYIKLTKTKNVFLNFEEYKAEKLNKIKLEYPYMPESDFKNSSVYSSIFSISKHRIQEYNLSLNNFYKDYEEKLNEIFDYEKRKSLSFDLQFMIENTGSKPAEDIDLHFHFPDGFELIESSKKEVCPILPKPPHKPKNNFDFGSIYTLPSSNFQHVNYPKANINFNSPTIKKTNSYDVDYNRKKLKHGYIEKLEKLTIIFDSKSEIKNFQIDFNISAANVIDMLSGKLNVVFID